MFHTVVCVIEISLFSQERLVSKFINGLNLIRKKSNQGSLAYIFFLDTYFHARELLSPLSSLLSC